MKSNLDELQEIENKLKHEKNRRMYERYQAVRLRLMGNTIHQISTILKRSDKTIGTYIRSYKKMV